MKLFLFILFKVGFFILFWASFLGSKTWPVRCSFAIIVVVGCAYVHSNFPLPGTFYCQNMSFLKKRYSQEDQPQQNRQNHATFTPTKRFSEPSSVNHMSFREALKHPYHP